MDLLIYRYWCVCYNACNNWLLQIIEVNHLISITFTIVVINHIYFAGGRNKRANERPDDSPWAEEQSGPYQVSRESKIPLWLRVWRFLYQRSSLQVSNWGGLYLSRAFFAKKSFHLSINAWISLCCIESLKVFYHARHERNTLIELKLLWIILLYQYTLHELFGLLYFSHPRRWS